MSLAVSTPHAVASDDEMSRQAQLRFESRLNELMLWRLSDELELKPQEETKLKEIIKKFQEERKSALMTQETALEKMTVSANATPSRVCTSCLTDFEKTVQTVASANTQEFKELRTLLGPQKMQKFLLIRSQMSKDVRDALRQPATPPGAPAATK